VTARWRMRPRRRNQPRQVLRRLQFMGLWMNLCSGGVWTELQCKSQLPPHLCGSCVYTNRTRMLPRRKVLDRCAPRRWPVLRLVGLAPLVFCDVTLLLPPTPRLSIQRSFGNSRRFV
jgi:hypothetical protein